jgi:hypothetical protein
MRRFPRPRQTPAHLSGSVQQRLNSYALAAGAAGVGMLALTQPAEARIVYTPADKNIEPHSRVDLDLNHDGIVDFSFKDFRTTNSFGSGTGRLSVFPERKTNGIRGHSVSGQAYASALLPREQIGPKKHFLSRAGMMATSRNYQGPAYRSRTSGVCTGAWAGVSNRYLGLKFTIQGETHFGWARLTVSCPYGSSTVTATLTGYAYETIPNRPILAGKEMGPEVAEPNPPSSTGLSTQQPATLGRLAQGAEGLVAWRKKEE